MSAIEHATDDTFQSTVIASQDPVLLDIWAPWCGPCKAMAPALDQLAEEYTGRLKIVKLDMDEHEDLVETLGVRSLPTLLFYKSGDKVGERTGGASKSEIQTFIDTHLT